jgi:spore maturation protein SpmA
VLLVDYTVSGFRCFDVPSVGLKSFRNGRKFMAIILGLADLLCFWLGLVKGIK